MLITGVSSGLGKALAEEALRPGLAGGVNSPKNDDPSLWEPVHPEPPQTRTELELLRE